MLVCECVWVQVTFKMHTHLIVCSTMNYIGFMGWPHPQPAPAQCFARWSVCVESIVNNVCECGCSILSSAPKNEMLSNWPLIVFVFSLRDLGHPDPLLLPVTHTHTHTHARTANALSVIWLLLTFMPLRQSAAATAAAVAATRHRRHRHLPSAIDAVRPWYPLNFLVSFYGSTIMKQRPLAGSALQ